MCERNKAHIKLVELRRCVATTATATAATAAAAAPTAVVKRMEKNVLTVKSVDGAIMYMHIVTEKTARYKTEIFK